jgi:hypothetical protein
VNFKTAILANICYTALVYGRINKKLNSRFTEPEIEAMLLKLIAETPETDFQKTGKNIYITPPDQKIRITINSNTYRVITVDKTETIDRTMLNP